MPMTTYKCAIPLISCVVVCLQVGMGYRNAYNKEKRSIRHAFFATLSPPRFHCIVYTDVKICNYSNAKPSTSRPV